MIQQINLYQNVLKPNQTKPMINRCFFSLIAAILLLIGYSIYLVVDLNSSKKNLQQAKQELSNSELQMALLKVQYPQQKTDPLLVQELSQSQNILNSLSGVIDLLTNNKSDQTQGFSRYFMALARQSIADVWLSQIIMDAEKNMIILKGSTYKDEKIPDFLKKLNKETVLHGRNFAKLSMTQAKDDENLIDFMVSTSTEILEKTIHD